MLRHLAASIGIVAREVLLPTNGLRFWNLIFAVGALAAGWLVWQELSRLPL